MICTGLLEDDPEGVYDLPENWKNIQNGVASFRYKNQD